MRRMLACRMSPCSRKSFSTFVAGALLATACLAGAGTLQGGDPLPPLALKDQHAKSVAVAADTRLIFFAAEMSSSKLVSKALEALPPTALRDGKAVYIADISSMPGAISTWIAIPKMQKLPYAVAVVTDASETSALPRRPDAVTVLKTEAGRITAVHFASTSEELIAYLK
jgi:hypothetical protein